MFGPKKVDAFSSQSRHFLNELLQHTQLKNLLKGQALHAQIIKSGSFSCIYLANSLVNFYAKCGHLFKAKLVFNNIGNKDLVSWNCLINGYSQQGPLGSHLVMELFQCMRAKNIFPDAHTFVGVFTAASNLLDVSGGQQAHTIAIKTVSFYDIFVGSSLLNMYCKMGFVFEALKLFERMPERNPVSWATMISVYATQELANEALELFELMRHERKDMNEFVYTSVLSAITVPELVDAGKQIHSLAIKNGLLSIISVGNALVTMYGKCGSLDDACQTFELLENKNSITWSAMITRYAQSGVSHKALKVFYNMHHSGMLPSEFTLVGVINACSDIAAIIEGKQLHGYSLKLGYELNMYLLNALVDMYAKCGSMADARKGFDYLQQPDIVLWTSMIAGYVKNGENEDALNLYCKMQMEGIIPNELTITSVLKACSNLAALDQGKQIHTAIIKYGFSLEIPVGSTLSAMYAKCGNLEDGYIVFGRMPTRDVISCNAMIFGLYQNGHGKEALELFEGMLLEGTKPDNLTFVNLLSACSHMGLVEKGWTYFKMMSDEFGIVPTVKHYACMIDILGRAGKLNEAKEFIESTTIDHGLYLWRNLLGACKNQNNYDLGAYVGEKLLELNVPESSAYVLLSSIYTALGKWEDVRRVRRLMKTRGVSKEPGCSWIELKSLVHVFVVGDQMHPKIDEVRSELQFLTKLMKDGVSTLS